MPPENRSVQVNLRLPPSLKEAAEQAAAQDHRSLASLIEKLLAEHLRTQPTLEEWHERALARFYAGVAEKKSNDADGGILARSYAINTSNADRLEASQLARVLRSVHDSLGQVAPRDDLFYVYRNNPDLIPYFTSDAKVFRKSMDEILEFLSIDTRDRVGFWRVSPAGLATHIDTHFEDREIPIYAQRGLQPGKWFWPLRLTQNLAGLIFHASEFAQRYPSAETVEFRCEWSGLRERCIGDPDTFEREDPRSVARTGHCITIGEWPVVELRRSWPEIASELGGPVMRLFDNGCDYSPDLISQSHLPRLRA